MARHRNRLLSPWQLKLGRGEGNQCHLDGQGNTARRRRERHGGGSRHKNALAGCPWAWIDKTEPPNGSTQGPLDKMLSRRAGEQKAFERGVVAGIISRGSRDQAQTWRIGNKCAMEHMGQQMGMGKWREREESGCLYTTTTYRETPSRWEGQGHGCFMTRGELEWTTFRHPLGPVLVGHPYRCSLLALGPGPHHFWLQTSAPTMFMPWGSMYALNWAEGKQSEKGLAWRVLTLLVL